MKNAIKFLIKAVGALVITVVGIQTVATLAMLSFYSPFGLFTIFSLAGPLDLNTTDSTYEARIANDLRVVDSCNTAIDSIVNTPIEWKHTAK